MDAFIVILSGKVEHQITIDPTVWIFDNRKINLEQFFNGEAELEPRAEEQESRPRRWQTNQIRSKKEAVITGAYGIRLEPFITTASPLPNARKLVAVTRDGHEISAPLKEGRKWIAGFSEDGKALKSNGPIHIYFGDGSNADDPIKNVTALRVD